mmetsp:Transcript_99735/g.171798  ORF Transcript_99735/g.171798 Transcript_99735/m.171798 type:complete len:291 (+) Transcript_99735:349-1221(+)
MFVGGGQGAFGVAHALSAQSCSGIGLWMDPETLGLWVSADAERREWDPRHRALSMPWEWAAATMIWTDLAGTTSSSLVLAGLEVTTPDDICRSYCTSTGPDVLLMHSTSRALRWTYSTRYTPVRSCWMLDRFERSFPIGVRGALQATSNARCRAVRATIGSSGPGLRVSTDCDVSRRMVHDLGCELEPLAAATEHTTMRYVPGSSAALMRTTDRVVTSHRLCPTNSRLPLPLNCRTVACRSFTTKLPPRPRLPDWRACTEVTVAGASTLKSSATCPRCWPGLQMDVGLAA